MKLLKLRLDIDSIIIGERVKGGIYRPCLETIPSTTVRGAFKYTLGTNVIGVGFFISGTYEIRDFDYSVKDKYLETSKIPFTTSCLYPKGGEKIKAEIYIANKGGINKDIFQNLTLRIGALKNKGFGKARVTAIEEIESEVKQGLLNIRILEEDAVIVDVTPISPIYGYLFYSEDSISGCYKLALFEGSLVKAPEVFLKEVTFYDE